MSPLNPLLSTLGIGVMLSSLSKFFLRLIFFKLLMFPFIFKLLEVILACMGTNVLSFKFLRLRFLILSSETIFSGIWRSISLPSSHNWFLAFFKKFWTWISNYSCFPSPANTGSGVSSWIVSVSLYSSIDPIAFFLSSLPSFGMAFLKADIDKKVVFVFDANFFLFIAALNLFGLAKGDMAISSSFALTSWASQRGTTLLVPEDFYFFCVATWLKYIWLWVGAWDYALFNLYCLLNSGSVLSLSRSLSFSNYLFLKNSIIFLATLLARKNYCIVNSSFFVKAYANSLLNSGWTPNFFYLSYSSLASCSWWASVNLALITASVRLSKKNAPMNTSGRK